MDGETAKYSTATYREKGTKVVPTTLALPVRKLSKYEHKLSKLRPRERLGVSGRPLGAAELVQELDPLTLRRGVSEPRP